jgi:hypothetical protein
METETIVWLLLGCGVWAVVSGAMLINCLMDEGSVFKDDNKNI